MPQPKNPLQLHVATSISTKTTKKSATCSVVLIDEDKNILAASLLDSDKFEQAHALINDSHFQGKLAEHVMAYAAGILLVGVGKPEKLGGTNLYKIAKTIYAALEKHNAAADILLGDSLDDRQFGQFALGLLYQNYQYHTYKSKKADAPVLTQLNLLVSDELVTDYAAIVSFQMAIAKGQSHARDLANEPPNICNPVYLANQARQLAKEFPNVLKVTVLGEQDMAKLGMNCFLAVSVGSDNEGQLVLVEYNNLADTKTDKKVKSKKSSTKTSDSQPIVLVGKGVTFDTGGISLKPGLGMGEMKFDMGGAAATLGAMRALCEANLPLHVVGALACVENMPSGKATRPGDIVTAMDGTTVEILNTDAEGRLVLADTLVYVQRYNPKAIIDMATLTGACVVALGSVRSAVYSNDEDVLFDLEQASELAHDRIWHMPLDDDYQQQLDSNMADVQNIGGMPAGSVTAACFLSRFVKDYPWAHLDIAGTAWQSGKEPSGTGRPVPLLLNYLQRQVI